MHQAAIDVRHICRKNRWHAAAQLDEPDRAPAAQPAALAFAVKWASLCAGYDDIAAPVASESSNVIGADASMPIARARCCVTIRLGALGLHSTANSCSRWLSRPSTGKANRTSPGGECAAFIRGAFFCWARSWNTESPESFRQKSDGFLGLSGR
jgi:hypothetical protein